MRGMFFHQNKSPGSGVYGTRPCVRRQDLARRAGLSGQNHPKEDFGRPETPLRPIRPWQEVVDGLAVRTPWLEAACIHSGYGELLMRHIKAAVDCFKKHIEVYDKWHNLLSESDVRRYFVNFTNPGQHTSQALYATLLALDAKQQSAAPPDPYRYEQRIDGRRSYLGCLIPDNAPPRPDNAAFWNETTNSWRS